MPKVSFSLDSSLDPDRVFQAMIDFSERRVEIWRALSGQFFKVHGLGGD